MRYLLDVNALIAFGVIPHQFHERVVDWVNAQRASTFLTTPITELGFVRVVVNVASYGLNLTQAKELLIALKSNPDHQLTFLPDASEISALPAWVNSPAQITDGHLVELARSSSAILATLDKGIPGSFLIP